MNYINMFSRKQIIYGIMRGWTNFVDLSVKVPCCITL